MAWTQATDHRAHGRAGLTFTGASALWPFCPAPLRGFISGSLDLRTSALGASPPQHTHLV